MEKNYETFVNNLRERLLKATGYQEEMICYKTAEEYPAYRWRSPAFEESAAGGCV